MQLLFVYKTNVNDIDLAQKFIFLFYAYICNILVFFYGHYCRYKTYAYNVPSIKEFYVELRNFNLNICTCKCIINACPSYVNLSKYNPCENKSTLLFN